MSGNARASQGQTGFARVRVLAVSMAAVLLLAFHAVGFLRRVEDSSISRPLVLARWVVAGALLVAAILARRILQRRDRRIALVFWLLAAVLHLFVPASADFLKSHDPVAVLVESVLALAPA